MKQPAPTSLWPRLLIAYFVLFITLLAVFVTFALKQEVHMVRPDYYAAEVAYQQRLDELNRAVGLGREAVVEHSAKHRGIGIQVPVAGAPESVTGTLRLYRPSDPALDREHELRVDERGRQFFDVSKLAAGNWRVDLRWTREGEVYLKERRIVVTGKATGVESGGGS